MAIHIIQQGECLSSLAARYGLAGWEQLHNDPANTELKKKRPNPNILFPGDEVTVPDCAPKSVSIATERTHTFVVKLGKIKLRVALVERSGKPYEGKRFIVNAGAREIGGKTAAGGIIEVEVPAALSSARLRVWLGDQGADALPTIDRDLSIGHIDPIETVSGVQGRLSNLAYKCAITNEIDDGLLSAARAFRANQGLPKVDEPEEATAAYEQLVDDAFRKKLLAAYEGSAA